jgi:putative flippase GtrA
MKFLRYISVQLFAYVLDMGGFVLLLNTIHADPIAANIFGKVLAGLFAFIAHRNFTFNEARNENKGRQAGMYFLLLALNVPLSSAALSVVLWFILNPVSAKLISDVVCVAISYWASKRFVFVRNSTGLTNQPPRQSSGL